MSDDFDLTPSQTQKNKKNASGSGLGILGLIGVILAKFKFLFFGLLKLKTLLSMFLFFGVYWNAYGWPLALGFVLSIYIHEMGHVSKLRHYGIDASAPMFIPFVGAFIRVQQAFSDHIQDARVGLAGPIWGLCAAVAAYLTYYFSHIEVFLAIGHLGAFINLFNLIPVWQLDGGRGFHSLNTSQRWMAFAAIALALILTQQGLLLFLLGFSVYQALKRDAPLEADWVGLSQYVFLVAVLSAMCMIQAPGINQP